MSFDDSGPAFPTPTVDMDGIKYPGCTGMSLRDWFAGQALAGLVSRWHGSLRHDGEEAAGVYSGLSFMFADAMLAERSKE